MSLNKPHDLGLSLCATSPVLGGTQGLDDGQPGPARR